MTESLKQNNFFHLSQELALEEIAQLRKRFFEAKKEDFTRCLQIVARLGSDPKVLGASPNWSPGEQRKIAIALAIVQNVHFLILDEPTNHLDLPSIQKLEIALKESNLTLLVVSHDSNFIQKVCDRNWEIKHIQNGDSQLFIR